MWQSKEIDRLLPFQGKSHCKKKRAKDCYRQVSRMLIGWCISGDGRSMRMMSKKLVKVIGGRGGQGWRRESRGLGVSIFHRKAPDFYRISEGVSFFWQKHVSATFLVGLKCLEHRDCERERETPHSYWLFSYDGFEMSKWGCEKYWMFSSFRLRLSVSSGQAAR